jgi:hypothetical protein
MANGERAMSRLDRSIGVRGDRIQTAEQEDERESDEPTLKRVAEVDRGNDVGELGWGRIASSS